MYAMTSTGEHASAGWGASWKPQGSPRHQVLMVGRGNLDHFLTWFHLSKAGITVLSAESGDDAADLLGIVSRRAGTPDLVVIDARIHAHEAITAGECIRLHGYRGPMLGLVPANSPLDRSLRERLARICDTYTSTPLSPDRMLELCTTMAAWGESGSALSGSGVATARSP